MGFCEKGRQLRRDNALVGDKIYVTGYLGDASIGLKSIVEKLEDAELQSCVDRLNRPDARVKFAGQLLNYSRCAIDISDGLIADLGHIVESSQCGAQVVLSDIPLSSAARYYFKRYNNNDIDWELLLTKGDDYELCFTLNADNESAVVEMAEKIGLKISCIGTIIEGNKLLCVNDEGITVNFNSPGFTHF